MLPSVVDDQRRENESIDRDFRAWVYLMCDVIIQDTFSLVLGEAENRVKRTCFHSSLILIGSNLNDINLSQALSRARVYAQSLGPSSSETVFRVSSTCNVALSLRLCDILL